MAEVIVRMPWGADARVGLGEWGPADPPFAPYPPSTAHLTATVSLYLGESGSTGPIEEELYVCYDNGCDASHYVLWAADNGSAWDDDVARMVPIAWVEIGDVVDPKTDEQDERHATEVLFYALVKEHGRLHLFLEDTDFENDATVTGSKQFPTKRAIEIMGRALRGEELYQPRKPAMRRSRRRKGVDPTLLN